MHALVAYIRFMNKEMNIPLRISELGTVSEGEYMSKINEMADAALADACTKTNPRVPTKEQVVELYKNIW